MEFLVILCVAAALSAWLSFGDEAAATGAEAEGAGSEGDEEGAGSEATSEGESSKFVAALKEKGLDNWAEVATRWDGERQKASEASTKLAAAEKQIAEMQEKLSSKSATQTRSDELMAQALKQGFTRSYINDYLDRNTLDQLENALAKDRDSSKSEKDDSEENTPAAMKEALDRIAKLEKAATTKEQNAELQRQLGGSLKEHAEDLDDEDKATIVGLLEMEVEQARASGKALPNIDESVKNLAARFKAIAEKAVEKYKEENKGSAVAAGSEQPNSAHQEMLNSEEDDVQSMYKLMRDS